MGKSNQEQWYRIGRESLALKEEKVPVTSGKKNASVRKETVAVSATIFNVVRKNQNTLPPRFLSQPHHEVEVSRGREVPEAKVTMGPFFDKRADIIWEVPVRERLVNIGIRPSANSYKNETGCKAGDKCLFPHYKVAEQPNKKPKKSYFPKRRESDDKNAVALVKSTTIGLRIKRFGCVGFSLRQTVQGKPDAKSLGTDSKNTIHSVYAASSEYPGKERTIVGKENVKVPHQRSPYATKFEDWSEEETERQQRCARSKAWNLA